MRFTTRQSRGTSYFSRSTQYRWLGLVGLVAVVMVMAQVLMRPDAWESLVGDPSQQESRQPPKLVKPIEIQRGEPGKPLPEDTNYARVDEDRVDEDRVDDDRADDETGDTPAVPDEPLVAEPDAENDESSGVLARLPKEWLQGVRDDWFEMTRVEQPALNRVLSALKDLPATEVEKLADPRVTFDVILSDPDYYRGAPITLTGRAKRIIPRRVGIPPETTNVWETWIVTPDSRAIPWLVLTTSLPEGMSQGDSVDVPVTVHGYFLRRFAYATRGGEASTLMVATPGLVQRTIVTPESRKAEARRLQLGGLVAVGIIGLLVLGLSIWILQSDRLFRKSRLHTISESRLDAKKEDLAALESLDGGDPHIIRIDDPPP